MGLQDEAVHRAEVTAVRACGAYARRGRLEGMFRAYCPGPVEPLADDLVFGDPVTGEPLGSRTTQRYADYAPNADQRDVVEAACAQGTKLGTNVPASVEN